MLEKKSERLRILQVNKLYYPTVGGIERVVQQIAEGLSEKTEMSVLVCSDDFHYRKEKQWGVTIICLPKLFQLGSLPVPLGLNFMLRRICRQQDIIHLHMPFPLGDLACLLSGFRGKIVLWWHSDVVRQKKLLRFYKPLMLRMLRRADAIVVATEGHIEGSAFLKPFREKCVVIPFGVEQKIEQMADRYIETVGSNLTENNPKQTEKLRFLFVGRLVYYKGCDVLLRAFASMQNAELVLVGTGKMESECHQLAKELGIEERCQFLGEISEEELYHQYAACDVFVLPSIARSEAFGLVQIEAMAFGKPVINTNLPSGVPYVSIHGETGLTVEPGNVKELAEAMQWMTDHKEERLRMGERARKRMKEEYRLEQMIEKVRELYQKLVKE